MPRVFLDISTSLDGFVAGPSPTLEQPLGKGGESLHDWAFRLAAWREPHGLEGGEAGPDGDLIRRQIDRSGAVVMARRMFSGGAGPWEDDPNADAWWGDDPPFQVPVFVLTHHPRETVVKEGGTSYTFVTEGIEAALEQACAAAGAKDVQLGGGAEAVQQYLNARLLDELNIHLVPVLLGNGGVRLLEGLEPAELELTRVIESAAVTHLRYRRRA